MNTKRSIFGLPLGLVLLIGACDFESLADFDRQADLDLEPEPPHPEARRAPPPLRLLHLAAELGGLRDDPTFVTMLSGLQTAHQVTRSAHDDLRAALAEMAGRGTLEPAALNEPLERLVAATHDEAEVLGLALGLAHELLDAATRQQVIDRLGARPAGPPPPGDGARPPGPGAHPNPGMDHERMLDYLIEELELDDGQLDALEATDDPPAPPPHEMLSLDAFADAGFDPDDLDLASRHEQHERAHLARHLDLLGSLLPLLDDDQRSILAEILLEPPPRP